MSSLYAFYVSYLLASGSSDPVLSRTLCGYHVQKIIIIKK